MRVILVLIYAFVAMFSVEGQKECFTRRETTSGSGPLKMSLIDPIKDFESGSYTIINKNTQESQRFTCFNITFLYVNGKTNYEVVASIQNVENYQDKEGLDFSVRFTTNPTVIEGLFIMSKTALWSSATIHYVVSSRADFRVGTFVPETTQFLPCGKESQGMVISHRMIKPWSASKKLVFGLPFLSGIRTMDSEMNINFNKSSFDPDTNLLEIPVSFEQVQYPIEYILISYLVVTMDSEFQITNIYDLDYIPSDINVFVGMTGVRTGISINSNTKTASVQSAPGVLKAGVGASASVMSKSKFREFFEVQGLVIQSTSNLDVLFSTGNYQTNTATAIECISVRECSRFDGFMKYYQNEDGFLFKSECILCDKFASYNNATNQCECREFYIRINGTCVSKLNACDKLTQVYNHKNNKCECANGYVERNNSCVLNSVCPPGFTSFRGSCYRITRSANANPASVANAPSANTANTIAPTTQSCQSPMFWNEATKSCQCPVNTYYDEITKICISCQENETWNPTTKLCECLNGAFRINGTCEFCNTHAFFNGTGCQCLPGFLGNGIICRQDPKFMNQTLGLTNTLNNNPQSQTPGNLSKESENVNPVILGTIDFN